MTTPVRHALALGLVAAFLGGNLLGLAHQSGERHARCPEHGEPVHLEQAGAALPPAPGDSEGVRSTSMSFEDVHDHCVVMSNVRERPSITAAASSALPAPDGAPLALAFARTGPSAGQILRLAPKTSPPV